MQKHDREEESRSRPSSRRNSASLSRRGSLNKEPEGKKINVTPSSTNSTPKRVYKPQHFDFTITGKQISSRGDRANSLPGSYHRRPSVDSMLKTKRSLDSARKTTTTPKSRDVSLEDDMSLDLSQVSDFEDMNAKYGLRGKIASMSASTKKIQKPRSSSLQSVPIQREPRRVLKSGDSKRSRENTLSCSRDSLYKTSSSTYRQAMSSEMDYSSMSPEYSAPSSVSVDSGPGGRQDTLVSPPSQDPPDYSCCVSTWQEVSEAAAGVGVGAAEGEWSHFWANYNNSLARVPVSRYYDQCPTPYRTEDIELADLDISKNRSPDNLNAISNIVRNEGLRLTPRETQNIIKCAHILGNVLSKAIDRQSKDRKSPEKVQELKTEPDPANTRKKSMTLNLRETLMPLEVKEEKRWESVPTQTDISLPNTKSAPKIFESILRQLSKSSLEDAAQNKEEKKVDTVSET